MVTRTALAITLIWAVAGTRPSTAASLYENNFTANAKYNASTATGPYTVADETLPSTWTTGAGGLTFSRPSSGLDPEYRYSTSVFLTRVTTPATGSTVDLTDFTVRGQLRSTPSDNSAQPGLVVAGSLEQGGYVVTIDNGQNSQFALLAVDAGQLVGDERTPQKVVKTFGRPAVGDSYDIVVTMHRPVAAAAHPSFDVSIVSTGPTSPGKLYEGSFADPDRPADFGGRQIGYRVRNPLDGQSSAFGPLSLSVPEPQMVGLLGVMFLASRRRSVAK